MTHKSHSKWWLLQDSTILVLRGGMQGKRKPDEERNEWREVVEGGWRHWIVCQQTVTTHLGGLRETGAEQGPPAVGTAHPQ